MALVKCGECGHDVSTRAEACPNCGAKPKKAGSIGNALGLLAIIILVISAVGYFSGNDKAPKSADVSESAQAAPPSAATESAPPPLNFDLPVETSSGTLVCPFAATLDVREGHGLQAAMKSRMEIFGRREDAEKAGCEEWREGLTVRLSDATVRRAKGWQAKHGCGMLEFDSGYVFSCELRNVRGATAPRAQEESSPSNPPTPVTLPPAEAKDLPPASTGIAPPVTERLAQPESAESQQEPSMGAASAPQ